MGSMENFGMNTAKISFLLWITSLLDIYINVHGFFAAFQSLTGSLKIFGRALLQRQISIAQYMKSVFSNHFS